MTQANLPYSDSSILSRTLQPSAFSAEVGWIERVLFSLFAGFAGQIVGWLVLLFLAYFVERWLEGEPSSFAYLAHNVAHLGAGGLPRFRRRRYGWRDGAGRLGGRPPPAAGQSAGVERVFRAPRVFELRYGDAYLDYKQRVRRWI